ncbi:hypothetical protein ABFS83_14G265900 [Erythranthe nasuta]
MASRYTAAVPPEGFEVPEGWEYISELKKNGTRVQYYTNVTGQKYYTEADLMSYVEYSKERGFSIYAPDFDARSARYYHRRGGLNSKTKDRAKSKKERERENRDDLECASALLDLSTDKEKVVQWATVLLQISSRATGDIESRSSRRLG